MSVMKRRLYALGATLIGSFVIVACAAAFTANAHVAGGSTTQGSKPPSPAHAGSFSPATLAATSSGEEGQQ